MKWLSAILIAASLLSLSHCGQVQHDNIRPPSQNTAPGIELVQISTAPYVARMTDSQRKVECYIYGSGGIWCHEVNR